MNHRTQNVTGDAYAQYHQEGASELSVPLAWDRVKQAVRSNAAEFAASVLLLVMVVSLVTVTAQKSITNDEIVLIPAAYNHVVEGKTQSVREHPPLSKFLAAMPLLFIQPNEAPSEQIDFPVSREDQLTYQVRFWETNPAIFESLSFWPRMPMIALTVGLGLLIFAFARSLFGARAAVLAAALFSVEPTILAHGRVVQTDVPASFGFLFVFLMLYRYTRELTSRRALWVGVAAGLALLAKFSMLLVAPVLLVFFLVLLWRARMQQQQTVRLVMHAAIVVVVVMFLIHAAYYFRGNPFLETDALWVKKHFPVHATAVARTVNLLSYILPIDFILGVFWQIWHNNEGHPAGLLGRYSRTGWWYYFPVAFALKTTLPFLLLSVSSLTWGVYEWIKRRDARFLWLLGPFALYTTFVMFSHIDIGVRYYLPAFPFLFILGGAFLDRLLKSRSSRRLAILVAVAMCWIAFEAARAYPNHMSYMNQLASARPRWWYLSDSNVEWGDDARELALYLHARGETRVRSAFLGDFLTLHHYGIERVDMMSPDMQNRGPTRYAAIGASFLNGSTVPEALSHIHWSNDAERVNYFDAYRHRTPEAVIGNSIYLYRIHE